MESAMLADLIFRAYGVELVSEPEPWPGGHVHPAWRVCTDRGEWFVKWYAGAGWPAAMVRATLELQVAAARGGAPVPHIARTVSGDWLAPAAGGHLAAMDWVPGVTGVSGALTPARARAAGEVLGQLHRVLAALPAAGPGLVPDGELVRQRAEELLALEDARPLGGEAGALAREAALYRLRAVAAQPPDPDIYAHAHWQPCHGDYYPPNLLFDGDRVAGVVDWDFAGPRWRAMEVTRAAVEAGYSLGAPWCRAATAAFLAGYQAVNPLAPQELTGGFRIWWDYLLWSCYPWPLPYTAPAQAPKDWLALARRRHGLMVWLGEHMTELVQIAVELS
jgi:Ser/Thr protein kinase RdoA (MazF antagonist)